MRQRTPTLQRDAPDARPPQRARSVEAKRQVREVLIEAGRELIAREGLNPISLRQIAKHAGYSPAMIYRYFPDKAALLLTIREVALDGFADRVQLILASEETPEAILHTVAEAGFDFAVDQAANFGMNMLTLLWNKSDQDREPLQHARDASASGARVHRLYEQAIQAYFDSIGAHPIAIDVAVATFMSAITGAVALPAGSAYRDFPERAAVMRSSIDMLIRAWKALAGSAQAN